MRGAEASATRSRIAALTRRPPAGADRRRCRLSTPTPGSAGDACHAESASKQGASPAIAAQVRTPRTSPRIEEHRICPASSTRGATIGSASVDAGNQALDQLRRDEGCIAEQEITASAPRSTARNPTCTESTLASAQLGFSTKHDRLSTQGLSDLGRLGSDDHGPGLRPARLAVFTACQTRGLPFHRIICLD